jgi:hypothetical protein
MTVFIQKGDAPLTVLQATKRGMAHVEAEFSLAGGRKGDEELVRLMPQSALPERLQEIVLNLGQEDYAAYAAAWETDNVVNGENNRFNHQLVAYRKAQARLARYALAVGQEEITEDRETGEFAEDGEPFLHIVIVQNLIEPEATEIEQMTYDAETGEETGTVMVPNPRVVADQAERDQAQAVIDATPVDVAAFDPV